MKMFRVRFQFQGNGKAIRWSGDVAVEPGTDIFASAKREFLAARRRARKGSNVGRLVRALAIPA